MTLLLLLFFGNGQPMLWSRQVQYSLKSYLTCLDKNSVLQKLKNGPPEEAPKTPFTYSEWDSAVVNVRSAQSAIFDRSWIRVTLFEWWSMAQIFGEIIDVWKTEFSYPMTHYCCPLQNALLFSSLPKGEYKIFIFIGGCLEIRLIPVGLQRSALWQFGKRTTRSHYYFTGNLQTS